MEKKLSNDSRVAWIDVARGLAVFIVVFGHTYISKDTFRLVYSFHMPLFFIISGLTVNRDKLLSIPIKEYVKKIAKRLLVPYFWIQFVSFPLWFFTYVVNSYSSSAADSDFFQNFIGVFFSNTAFYGFPSRASWFFTTMFLVLVGYRIILQIAKKNEFRELVLILFCLVISYTEEKIHLPWHFNVAFSGIVFVYIGTCLIRLMNKYPLKYTKNNGKEFAKRLIVIAVLTAAAVVLQRNNGRVSMAANNFGKSVFAYYFVAIMFSEVFLIIVKALPEIKIFSYVGKNTLFIVGTHKLIMQTIALFCPIKVYSDFYQFILSIILYFALIPLIAIVNRFAPYIAGNAYKVGILQEISKYFVTTLALVIPVYYAWNLIGGYFNYYYTVVPVVLITIALSVLVVAIGNRFFPFIFGMKNKKGRC